MLLPVSSSENLDSRTLCDKAPNLSPIVLVLHYMPQHYPPQNSTDVLKISFSCKPLLTLSDTFDVRKTRGSPRFPAVRTERCSIAASVPGILEACGNSKARSPRRQYMIPDWSIPTRNIRNRAVAIAACAGFWILCRIEQQCKKHIHALPIELLRK